MSRRIYVDIDDVLSLTIERLIRLLEDTHGRQVHVEDVLHFDLEKSFGLGEAEIHDFMSRAYTDEEILAIDPVPGAVDVLRTWASEGHSIRLVTGRPPTTNAASRKWLDRHEMHHDELHHLDKWGRPTWNTSGLPALRFDDLHEMNLAFAVEDNLDTAIRLAEDFDLTVALMDRPWNRDVGRLSGAASECLVRCRNWSDVAAVFSSKG